MPRPQNIGGYTNCQTDAIAAAQRYNLPPSLLYSLIQAESSCRVDPGNSGAGAVGIAQIKPGTFSQYGCSGSVYNPTDAINCAGKILSSLYGQFGSYALSLAGYQAGAGNVAKSAPCVPGTADKNETTLQYVLSILRRAGLPFDAQSDCSGQQPGQQQQAQNMPPQPGLTTTGAFDPQVRKYLILGLALILLTIAFTRFGAKK